MPENTTVAEERANGAWTASGDGWSLSWAPKPPHLSGDAEVVDAVAAYLAERVTVAVTPTGPYLAANAREPLVVLSALVSLAYVFRTLGPAPEVPGVPDGAVA